MNNEFASTLYGLHQQAYWLSTEVAKSQLNLNSADLHELNTTNKPTKKHTNNKQITSTF